jgi:hypothetical protein
VENEISALSVGHRRPAVPPWPVYLHPVSFEISLAGDAKRAYASNVMRTPSAALLVVVWTCVASPACSDDNSEPAVAPPALDGTSAAAGQCPDSSPEAAGDGGAGQGCYLL